MTLLVFLALVQQCYTGSKTFLIHCYQLHICMLKIFLPVCRESIWPVKYTYSSRNIQRFPWTALEDHRIPHVNLENGH